MRIDSQGLDTSREWNSFNFQLWIKVIYSFQNIIRDICRFFFSIYDFLVSFFFLLYPAGCGNYGIVVYNKDIFSFSYLPFPSPRFPFFTSEKCWNGICLWNIREKLKLFLPFFSSCSIFFPFSLSDMLASLPPTLCQIKIKIVCKFSFFSIFRSDSKKNRKGEKKIFF